MQITYERKVKHCKVSPYIKQTKIEEIKPALNSDFLESITLEDLGWSIIARKGTYAVGDSVTFIPPESVLPKELSDALEVTNYLSKGKVKVVRLRGNRSEGLITNTEKTAPYIDYILKWEDLPKIHMQGNAVPSQDIPIHFNKFYKMPNLLDEPNTFKEGESVVFSEKIHGSNVRVGKLRHPELDEYQLYVGSHNIVLKQDDNNTVYWRAISQLGNLFPKDYVFFGEVFGKGIQHLHYDKEEQVAVLFFAATYKGEYLKPNVFKKLCDKYKIPRVKMHPTVFSSIKTCRKWADLDSELTDSHGREGIVVTSAYRAGIMAKVISFDYLTSKNRTERH